MDPAEPIYALTLSVAEVEWMVSILDAYGREWYSGKHSPEPLDDLRARVEQLLAQVRADQ